MPHHIEPDRVRVYRITGSWSRWLGWAQATDEDEDFILLGGC